MIRAIAVGTLAGALACGPEAPPEATPGETGDAASSSGAETTGTSSTTGTPTSSGTGSSGGDGPSVWRGRLSFDWGGPALVIDDCASGVPIQLLFALPDVCSGLSEQELWVEVTGVPHADGGDLDWLDEVEVTELLVGPCRIGGCGTDEWAECGQFEDFCALYDECDQWVQDCPEGEKCMPYSSDGDSFWDSLKCVPVMPGAGGEGEPCTVEGSGVSGIDSCAKGHMCWDVDPETKIGTCVAQCTGAPDNPQCPDPCKHCLIDNGYGVLTLCLDDCDPVAQDCNGMDLCVPNSIDEDLFICVLDASGEEGQLFDPCEYTNACDAGLWCAPPAMAVECDQQAFGCCLPFCDLTMPACPGAGQQCVPWSDEVPPPACLGNVGRCRVP